MKHRLKDQVLVLSDRDREVFVDALVSPPTPSKRLIQAAKNAMKGRRRPIGLAKDVVISHLSRITKNPQIREGQPIVRNLRITVGDILDHLASGMTEKEILKNFPDLTRADILACLSYASEVFKGTILAVQGSVRPYTGREEFNEVRRSVKRTGAKRIVRK